MADIVLFGAGDIAAVAKTYIDAHSDDRIVGFTADAKFCRSHEFCGLPLVAWEELEQRFPPDAVRLLGPISYRRMNEFRRDRHLDGKARGYSFASFIHPAAHVYTQEIGENAFILELNIIQPFVRIGQGVILWSGNHIGHHSVVEDYCFFAGQAGIASNCRVGERSFFGAKVSLAPGVTVGAGSLVSLGSTITKDVPEESLVRAPGADVQHAGTAKLKRLL